MLQQALPVSLRLAAHAAEAALGGGVSLGVVQQRAPVAELHPANFTAAGSPTSSTAFTNSRSTMRRRSNGLLTGSARLGFVFHYLHHLSLLLLRQLMLEWFNILLCCLRSDPHLLLLLLLLLLDGRRLRLLEVLSVCRGRERVFFNFWRIFETLKRFLSLKKTNRTTNCRKQIDEQLISE